MDKNRSCSYFTKITFPELNLQKIFHRRLKKNVDGFLGIWFSNDNTAVFDQHTFLVVFMDTEPLNITKK